MKTLNTTEVEEVAGGTVIPIPVPVAYIVIKAVLCALNEDAASKD